MRFVVSLMLHIHPGRVSWFHGFGPEMPGMYPNRSSETRYILANGTKEEAPQGTFKKTYLVAFLGHTDATGTT